MPFPRTLDRLAPACSSEEQRARRRRLREAQTEAEAALWQLLRNRKLLGSKFRRQVAIGRYVADFYCHERKLIVELDGGIHSDRAQQLHDQSRDAFLIPLGLRVLRIQNEELLHSPEQVLDRVRNALITR